jgi:hypothetical protein
MQNHKKNPGSDMTAAGGSRIHAAHWGSWSVMTEGGSPQV